jgi:hypothetical protein
LERKNRAVLSGKGKFPETSLDNLAGVD